MPFKCSAQFHGTRSEKKWSSHFGVAASSEDGKWHAVFKQHPEFFRIEPDGDVVLRWRHAFERTYDPRTNIDHTPEGRDKLTQDQVKKLHRRPLGTDQIGALMHVAIESHARALAQAQDVRWKLNVFTSLIGGLIAAGLGFAGVIIAALIRH